MIKKNTKFIFQNGENARSEDMLGGIPLSKGEIISVHEGNKVTVFEVVDKIVDCFMKGDDQVVNITYVVKTR